MPGAAIGVVAGDLWHWLATLYLASGNVLNEPWRAEWREGAFSLGHSRCLAWPSLRPKPLMVLAESFCTASTLSSIALMRSDTSLTASLGSDIATSQISGAGASPLSGLAW